MSKHWEMWKQKLETGKSRNQEIEKSKNRQIEQLKNREAKNRNVENKKS